MTNLEMRLHFVIQTVYAVVFACVGITAAKVFVHNLEVSLRTLVTARIIVVEDFGET